MSWRVNRSRSIWCRDPVVAGLKHRRCPPFCVVARCDRNPTVSGREESPYGGRKGVGREPRERERLEGGGDVDRTGIGPDSPRSRQAAVKRICKRIASWP